MRLDGRRIGLVLAIVTAVLAVGAIPATAVQGDGSGQPPPASLSSEVAFGQETGTGVPALADAVARSQAEGSGEPASLAVAVSLARADGSGLPT